LLTGFPTADSNVALVHQNEESALIKIVEQVKKMAVPACVFLADHARALTSNIDESWSFAGTTPFMSLDLEVAELKEDSRVRLALREDFEAVVALMSETFGMDYDTASQGASPLKNPNTKCNIWIIEDDGQPISTAITRRVGDSITLWNMATSPRFVRRGYGRAIMNHALHQARQDGAKTGLLMASDAGKPLYEATGWVSVEDWDVYLKVTTNN
jgi:GNAT superfamily N-acetyltransferase